MSHRRDWRPREITPEGVGVTSDIKGLREYLDGIDLADELARQGALWFRGFDITEDTVDDAITALLPNRLAYVQGNTPRTKVGENLYTSTEYPPEYVISMHNELSYTTSWPSRLFFCCVRPADTGGATPVVDGAAWLAALDPEIRAAFADGVRYQRYLHGGRGLGKSWQETFETRERDEVERVLASAGADWEWTASGALRTSVLRPATVRHPVTGREVWFNQVDQWHPASLGEDTMRELAEIVPADELPQFVTFADGSRVPDDYALAVRDTGLDLAVDVTWGRGDVLLIDNVAVGHGRRAFTGTRRVLVAMSQ